VLTGEIGSTLHLQFEGGSQRVSTLDMPGIEYDAEIRSAGLGVCDLWIGRAEDYNSGWFWLHLRCIVLRAKGRPRILHCAVEAPPSRDNRKNDL
jgi:hypothetical protein